MTNRIYVSGVLRIALATLLLLMHGGCQAINHLRDAQEAFSRAAEIENRASVADVESMIGKDAVLSYVASEPRVHYKEARVSLDAIKADATLVQQLKDDGLWAHTQTLDAFTAWRLGDYAAARATAVQANGLADLAPRDNALLRALPGLVKNSEAADKIRTLSQGDSSFRSVEALLESALVDLSAAGDLVEPTHPVQIYLTQAQLAVRKNEQVAYSRLHPTSRVTPQTSRDAAGELLETLKRQLGSREGAEGVVSVWKWRLGL